MINFELKVKQQTNDMGNWLEEAEREVRRNEPGFRASTDRIKIKKDRIRENYLKIQPAYDGFIQEMNKLIDRVNTLPLEKRQNFGKIDAKSKASKLDNELYIFSSSTRIKRRTIKKISSFFKPSHFKHVRVFFISISKNEGRVDVELKDSYLVRERMKSHSKRKEDQDSDKNQKLNLLLSEDISCFNKDAAMSIVSWLAFKNDVDSLPFDLNKALIKE